MKSSFSLFLYGTLFLCSFSYLQAQWVRQYPMAKLEDVLDIDVSSDGNGFAVGANDLILRTLAGNNQWELLPGLGKGWRFQAVDYLNGSNGNIAAAGGNGLIFTLDKGVHWNEIPGAPAGIHTIRIFSPTHMIVASADGVYLWENDVWTSLNVGAPVGLKGAFVLNDQVMWAYTLATNPAIYYTTNGGMNWTANVDLPRVDLVRFFDAQNGIALNGRDVYQSTNGGQLWTLLAQNGLKNSANDLSFGSSANVLIAATLNAKPNISIDGGVTWNEISTNLINQRSFSVSAVSDTDFWIGNDLSGVMHSSDGGTTWEETSGPTRNIIQDIYFLNGSTGFAIGQKGLILRTMDGGNHWENISFGTRSYFSIHGLYLNDLWIGTNQRILHSVDAGDTWTEAVVFPGGNINDVLAISADRILAVSTTGYIYLSKTAGMTWDSVYKSSLQMRSVARIDDLHYMATGFNGVIVRSDDQGESWHTVTIPEPGLQYEQSFFVNGEGWLVTSSFKKSMWHTSDKGATWDTLTLPIDRFWDGVYFITPDTGIVVGRSSVEGRAYLTFDGGHHWQAGYITSFPLFGVSGVPNPNGTAWIYGYGSDIEILPYCNALPIISNFTGNLFPCEKDTVTYSISSQNIDQFTWHFPPGWHIIGNGNNDTVSVVAGSNFGIISVSGSNFCGESGQLNFNVSPLLLPVLINISGNASPCTGETISYSVNASNVDNFSWSLPDDWSIEGDSDLASIMVQVGSMDGLISVTGSNSCGTSINKVLGVIPKPQPAISFLSANLTPCPGDTVTVTFESDFLNSITLSTEGLEDWTVINSQIPNTVRAIAGHDAGTLQIFAVNTCGTSSPISVVFTPLFVPDVSILTNGAQLNSSVEGISYQWYLNGVPIAGATEDTLTPSLSGAYTVLVAFDNGCKGLSTQVDVVISGISYPSSIVPLEVYPMPASDELFLKGIIGEFRYSIIDLLGKNILQDHSSINKIQIGTLSEGLYLLKVEKGGFTYLTRFIINRN